MMFKNSCKLFRANFGEVWKLFVFHILSLAFCVGLLAVFYKDYINCADIAAKKAEVASIWETGTFYGSAMSTTLTVIANFIIYFFEALFASNIWKGIYFLIIVAVLLPLLINIGKVVTCELLYGYMSACQKQSFTGTFLKTLKTALAYSSVKVFYALPFEFLILASMWGITRVNNHVFDYFMPFIFVGVSAVLLAFKELFNAGWAPAKVVYDHNVVSSYTIGMRAVLRRWDRIFLTAVVIYLMAIVLAMLLGLYSLIIIIPILPPFLHIFELVAFFSSQGMRFYVDNETILSPKRLEEVDKIEDAKYLI